MTNSYIINKRIEYYHNTPLLVLIKDAEKINGLIKSIKNHGEKVKSKNMYFELIFVGDHESIRKDEQSEDIKYNFDVRFEMLTSDFGKSQLEECVPHRSMQKKLTN